MSGRGRRAVLPPANHRTDPPLAPDGLVVTVINQAGYKKEYNFAEVPVTTAMQHSLAAVFAAQARQWDSHHSARAYWRTVKVFADFLSQLEHPPADLDGLTAAMLKRWRTLHIGTNTGKRTLATARTLLQRYPALTRGPAADELAKRVPRARPSKQQSYEEADRNRVRLVARQQFRSALLRIRENTRLLERWWAGDLSEDSREWRIGQVLDQISRTGDVPRIVLPSGEIHVKNGKLLGGRHPTRTWGRLFLTRQELTALAFLLTDRFGWNLSAYDRLPTPITAPSAGETASITYQVQVEKRRSGGGRWFSTENITDSGADSSGRLITHALEATAHGRTLAAHLSPGVDLLMVARTQQVGRNGQEMDRPRPLGPLAFGISDADARHWARSHGLGGSPFRRSRRTTVTREGRPLQHTQGTHESVYVLPDQRVQHTSQGVFAAGALEAMEQARAVTFAGEIADKAVSTHQQTAMADCEDERTSPWPAPEGGCGADFLLCLACPNAHVHPGHHPRLAYLHQQLQSLRSVLDDRTWNKRWSDHLLRLEDLRNKIGPMAWNASLARVDGSDQLVVELLMKEELAP